MAEKVTINEIVIFEVRVSLEIVEIVRYAIIPSDSIYFT